MKLGPAYAERTRKRFVLILLMLVLIDVSVGSARAARTRETEALRASSTARLATTEPRDKPVSDDPAL